MRVLVTGADGFVAGHLVPYLRGAGHEVVGGALDASAAAALGVDVRPLDVTDAEACVRVVRTVAPTHVVHLAAVSSVPWSRDHPEDTRRINVEGTRFLLEAAAVQTTPPRVLVVGSAEEYGLNDGQPLTELPLADLQPRSPYAESKVEVERLIEREPNFRALAVRTRSFPHIGPGQKVGFFTSDVASQLARIESGEAEPVLHIGNVDAVRDFTDVRDVVRAYALLLERGVPGEAYNVCSGRGIAIKDILAVLLRLSESAVRVERDLEKVRLVEIPVLVGSNAKLRAATGWSPTIPLEQSLRDILAWWRQAVTT